MIADANECDNVSNGDVFSDKEGETITIQHDPNPIQQNVEQLCRKIMSSAGQSSMPKFCMISKEASPHDNPPAPPDVIFSTLRKAVGNNTSLQEHYHNDEEVGIGMTNNDVKPNTVRCITTTGNAPAQPRVVKWTLETMALAMDSVLSGKMTTTNAARKFGIPRTTLLDRLAMKVKRQHLDAPGTFPLNAENDAKVVDFIQRNSDLDKSTLLKGILAMAERLAKEQGKPFDNPLVTRKWLKLFVHKHPSLDILKFSRPRNVHQNPHSLPNMTTHVKNFPNNELLTSSHMIRVQNHQHNENVPSFQYKLQQQSQQQQEQHHHQQPQLQQHHHQQHQQQLEQRQHQLNELELDQEQEEEESVTTGSIEMQKMFDSFESNLARLAADAVERNLSSEQCAYFDYRYHNSTLERGFELWKLCKSKTEGNDLLNSFESVLSTQALLAIEQALVPEHLKYFRYRYENHELEEGYNLWFILKEKSHS